MMLAKLTFLEDAKCAAWALNLVGQAILSFLFMILNYDFSGCTLARQQSHGNTVDGTFAEYTVCHIRLLISIIGLMG